MVCDALFHHNWNPWRLPAMYATLQLMETIIHVSAALTYGDYRPCESSFDCGQRRVEARGAPHLECGDTLTPENITTLPVEIVLKLATLLPQLCAVFP